MSAFLAYEWPFGVMCWILGAGFVYALRDDGWREDLSPGGQLLLYALLLGFGWAVAFIMFIAWLFTSPKKKPT